MLLNLSSTLANLMLVIVVIEKIRSNFLVSEMEQANDAGNALLDRVGNSVSAQVLSYEDGDRP